MNVSSDRRETWIISVFRTGLTVLVGIAATMVATSAACRVASVRGPQVDVLLGPIDPAIEGAQVFIVGTLSGAVALICGFRLWTQVRSHSARRPPSVTQSNN
jgi:hypothetical protein